MTTLGVRVAAAMCDRPVSLQTTIFARDVNAASTPRPVRPQRSAAGCRIELAVRLTRSRSSGPPVRTTLLSQLCQPVCYLGKRVGIPTALRNACARMHAHERRIFKQEVAQIRSKYRQSSVQNWELQGSVHAVKHQSVRAGRGAAGSPIALPPTGETWRDSGTPLMESKNPRSCDYRTDG